MSLTKSKLRDLINAPTQIRDGVIFTHLDADDDYRYDVLVTFNLDEDTGKLQVSGYSTNMKATGDRVSDALLFCNKYNEEKAFLSVHYDMDDQDFNASWTMLTQGVSDEYIQQNIKIIIVCIWQFFVKAGKEF